MTASKRREKVASTSNSLYTLIAIEISHSNNSAQEKKPINFRKFQWSFAYVGWTGHGQQFLFSFGSFYVVLYFCSSLPVFSRSGHQSLPFLTTSGLVVDPLIVALMRFPLSGDTLIFTVIPSSGSPNDRYSYKHRRFFCLVDKIVHALLAMNDNGRYFSFWFFWPQKIQQWLVSILDFTVAPVAFILSIQRVHTHAHTNCTLNGWVWLKLYGWHSVQFRCAEAQGNCG